jgi:hypothetical protein
MLQKVKRGDDTEFNVIFLDWGKEAGAVIDSPSRI